MLLDTMQGITGHLRIANSKLVSEQVELDPINNSSLRSMSSMSSPGLPEVNVARKTFISFGKVKERLDLSWLSSQSNLVP